MASSGGGSSSSSSSLSSPWTSSLAVGGGSSSTSSNGSIFGGGATKHVPKCFDILPFPSIKCRVHPVVVFTILDAYVRREQDQSYVIGTLMGIVSEGNVVDITDCFVDRHSLTESGLLQIIKDHHESMYELKQKVNPKELVVGWFCTGAVMTELTCAVHGWFKSFSNVSKFQPQAPLVEPIHLMVDTTMANGHLTIKSVLQVPMGIVKEACFQFQEIPMEIYTSQAEKAGMSILLKSREAQKRASSSSSSGSSSISSSSSSALSGRYEAVPPLKDGFEASLDKLSELLKKCSEYVSGVLERGDNKGDSEIGRALMKALCSESIMDPDQFDQMCQTSLQDTLMVAYLASLARLQFAVAEKLNTSFF